MPRALNAYAFRKRSVQHFGERAATVLLKRAAKCASGKPRTRFFIAPSARMPFASRQAFAQPGFVLAFRNLAARIFKRPHLPASLRNQEEHRNIGGLVNTPAPRCVARMHEPQAARAFVARALNIAPRHADKRFHLGNLPSIYNFVAHSLPSFLPANLFNG